jgi:hypothetical protein
LLKGSLEFGFGQWPLNQSEPLAQITPKEKIASKVPMNGLFDKQIANVTHRISKILRMSPQRPKNNTRRQPRERRF